MKKMNLFGLPVELNTRLETYCELTADAVEIHYTRIRSAEAHYNGAHVFSIYFDSTVRASTSLYILRKYAKRWANSLPKKVQVGIRKKTLKRAKELQRDEEWC